MRRKEEKLAIVKQALARRSAQAAGTSRGPSIQTADAELIFSAALGLVEGAVRLRVELLIGRAGALYPADAEAASGLQRGPVPGDL